MKLASFDNFKIGVLGPQGQVHDVTRHLPFALDTLPRHRMSWLIEHWADLHWEIEESLARSPARPLDNVTLLAPVPAPGHVFAAPLRCQKPPGDFKDRALSMTEGAAAEQAYVLKAQASVVGPGQVIALPMASKQKFGAESKLAVIIGKHGRNIPRARALEYVFGYSCLVDICTRNELELGRVKHWACESFAGCTPLGPWVVTVDEVGDPGVLFIRLYVNDEIRQDTNTRDLIVGVGELIELVSSVLPIQPGDVIATSSALGLVPITPGDRVRTIIERVGEMTLQVVEAAEVEPQRS